MLKTACLRFTFLCNFEVLEALPRSSFGEGMGRIWLSNVQCTGTETSILNCTSIFNQTNSCTHAQDAGVSCLLGMYVWWLHQVSLARCLYIGCPEGGIRLIQGITALEGRVEICHSNRWGTVCDNGWERSDTKVACRQLGLSSAGRKEKILLL